MLRRSSRPGLASFHLLNPIARLPHLLRIRYLVILIATLSNCETDSYDIGLPALKVGHYVASCRAAIENTVSHRLGHV